MIEAVGLCNASCSYCPRGAKLLPNSDDTIITPAILDKSLQLAKQGTQKAIYLHHSGEPLLHPEIGAVIRKVRESGFLAYLSTNLIAGSEDKLTEILAAGLNQAELHLSGGLTRLDVGALWERVHMLYKLNWRLRNNGCKIEANYALRQGETEESVRKSFSGCSHYDETMYIRFYKPHDWLGLMRLQDKGIRAEDCEWYKNKAAAILCNGDVVICCLDQMAYSNQVNVLDVEEIVFEHLSRRDLCKGCIQQSWDMDWLRKEALEIPPYMERSLRRDSLR